MEDHLRFAVVLLRRPSWPSEVMPLGFFASVNGEIVPAERATVSILDNGFTFGDAVYETLRTYGGRPFHLERHLRRLRASAGRLGIEIPLDDAEMARRLDALLVRAANDESYIRIVVSRGRGDISYKFDRVQGPTVVLVAKPYERFPDWYYTRGIPVILSSVRRNSPRALDPAIKSCNLLNNILAVREAQAQGAVEPLMLNETGEVAEGASSNVFLAREGSLVTPPLEAGILPGITREIVLELCRAHEIPRREEPVAVKDLLAADEAFITSTLKEIVPIATVDGRAVGAGRPGPITLRLLQAYRDAAPGHAR
jgi:branched-chain amino acid aminotransferase